MGPLFHVSAPKRSCTYLCVIYWGVLKFSVILPHYWRRELRRKTILKIMFILRALEIATYPTSLLKESVQKKNPRSFNRIYGSEQWNENALSVVKIFPAAVLIARCAGTSAENGCIVNGCGFLSKNWRRNKCNRWWTDGWCDLYLEERASCPAQIIT